MRWKKKREIGKRLAVIAACALRDRGMKIETMDCIMQQASYIAGEIGGVRLLTMIRDAVIE